MGRARQAEEMATHYHHHATFSDPVFPNLKGKEIGSMWLMLCRSSSDLTIDFARIINFCSYVTLISQKDGINIFGQSSSESKHGGIVRVNKSILMHRLFAASKLPPFTEWFKDLMALDHSLHLNKISPAAWQQSMDRLFGAINLSELVNAIDLDKVKAKFDFEGKGEKFIHVYFAEVPGFTKPVQIETKLAGIQKGRSIPPHGHSNMVSAFLTISGEIFARQFDRIDETEDSLIIKKTQDKLCRPGDWTSISDVKNNIHWLTATTNDAFLFSNKVVGINPKHPTRGRIPIDPHRGTRLGSNTMAAPKISAARCAEIYG